MKYHFTFPAGFNGTKFAKAEFLIVANAKAIQNTFANSTVFILNLHRIVYFCANWKRNYYNKKDTKPIFQKNFSQKIRQNDFQL